MKKILLLLRPISLADFVYSQNCSCAGIFAWTKETMKKNDAGFQYVIDQKGETEYKKFTDDYAEKVKTISGKEECAEAIANWLKFFRKGHLWFGVNAEKNISGNNKIDNEKIKKQFENWEIYPYQEKEFDAYKNQRTGI